MFNQEAGGILDAARDRMEEGEDRKKRAYAEIALAQVKNAVERSIGTMCTVGYSEEEAMRLIAAYIDVIHDKYRTRKEKSE